MFQLKLTKPTPRKCVISLDKVNVFYDTTLWQTIALSTVIQRILHRLSDEIREYIDQHPETDRELDTLRSQMIHYYDIFKNLTIDATLGADCARIAKQHPEAYEKQVDTVCDVMLQMSRSHARRANTFINAILSRAYQGVDNGNILALCSTVNSLDTIMELLYEDRIGMLGDYACVPDFVPRGFEMMQICIGKIDKIFNFFKGEQEFESEINDDVITAQFNKLIEGVKSTEVINKCLKKVVEQRKEENACQEHA